MTLILLQSAAVRDTVFLVQQKPGWQSTVEALAAVAQIVLAIALLSVGLGVLFAALRVKKLIKKVEEQGQKLRIDLAPAIHNVTAVTENVNYVSKTVKRDADRLSESVTAATAKLKDAAAVAEQRVGEFNALIGVVQEEAEALFVGGAAAVHGLRAGADTFRRYQTGELRLDEGADADGVYEEDEDDRYGQADDDARGLDAGGDDEPPARRMRFR